MQHNLLLNQPLAIESGYLYSYLASMLLHYKQGILVDATATNVNFENGIIAQATSAKEQGADTFPVVINIKGAIIKYSNWSMIGTQTLIGIIGKLEKERSVSGILFDIDSGGGMVSGTAELCEVIKNTHLPTIAYTNGYMCSAAYDIASACDKRVASPHADLIGSIGTMLSYQDYTALFEKLGAKIYEIYAPQSSEKNIEWRSLKAGDESKYTERLEQVASAFINRVKANLGDTLKDDGHVLKGKTYNPEEALKIGLIDELADFKQALNYF